MAGTARRKRVRPRRWITYIRLSREELKERDVNEVSKWSWKSQ